MAETVTYPVEYIYITMWALFMFAMGFNANV